MASKNQQQREADLDRRIAHKLAVRTATIVHNFRAETRQDVKKFLAERGVAATKEEVEEVTEAAVGVLKDAMAAQSRRAAFVVRRRPPRGFRVGAQDELVCPHRDLTCCDGCAKAHVEVVVSGGRHYWIATKEERAEWAAELAKIDAGAS